MSRSLSYVMVMSSMAFLLMTVLYNLIDVAHVWSGAPFTYLGITIITVIIISYVEWCSIPTPGIAVITIIVQSCPWYELVCKQVFVANCKLGLDKTNSLFHCTINTVFGGVAQLTSVYDRRTFPGLCHGVQLIGDPPLYVTQPTWPTQPFILLWSINQ